MRKMPKVDEYDPVVYPRKLWVTDEVEGLDRIFKFMRANNFNLENQDSYHNLLDEKDHGTGVLITCPVVNKISGDYGILIIILNLPLVGQQEIQHTKLYMQQIIYFRLLEVMHKTLQNLMSLMHTQLVGQLDAQIKH